ncbi:hypothetical protein [Nonomuraea typhae]|nr:hypothetical protein [Nonomuraea typhae]
MRSWGNLDEYIAALIDAMQAGGAGEALPDDGPWYLYRVQEPGAD